MRISVICLMELILLQNRFWILKCFVDYLTIDVCFYLQEGNLLSQTKVGQLERKLKGSPRSMDSM